jgi:hypothetical protein
LFKVGRAASNGVGFAGQISRFGQEFRMTLLKTPLKALGSAVALVCAGMLSPAPAHAAVISFLQNGYGTIPQVTISGFDIQTPDQVPPTPNFAQVVQNTTGIYTTGDATLNVPNTTGVVALVDQPGGFTLALESINFDVVAGLATIYNVTFQAEAPDTLPAPAVGYVVANSGNNVLTDSFYDLNGAPVALPPGLSLSASLPEPASLVILAGGLAGLGLVRRRRG